MTLRNLAVPIVTCLVLTGFLLLAFGMIALLDPVGTQVTGDGDPFGLPFSAPSPLAVLGAGVLSLGVAALLVRRVSRSLRSVPN